MKLQFVLLICLALVAATQATSLLERLASSPCTAEGGTCKQVSQGCSTRFETGKCPGPASVKCCRGSGSPGSPSSSSSSPGSQRPVQSARCRNIGGECRLPSTGCGGANKWVSGLCAGVKPKCCAPKSFNGRPKFADVVKNYPQGSGDIAKRTMGGRVNMGWITNTCACRMSYCLNLSGFKIRKNAGLTITDKHKNNIYFRVLELVKVIRRRMGSADIKDSGVEADEKGVKRKVPQKKFKGKKGIIYFDTRGAWGDASGHFDLWDGEFMVEKGHRGASINTKYFKLSRDVYLWELP